MTNPPGVGPDAHRTQNYLLTGLRLLLNDANLPNTLAEDDRIANRVAQAVHELGLDAAVEANRVAIERAVDELSPLAGLFAGPTGMDVRFLTMTGALYAASQSADLIPPEVMRAGNRPDLEGLTDALRPVVLAAGSGLRKRAADGVRGLYVIVDPQLTNGREPIEVAARAIDGGASAIQWRDKARDKGDQAADLTALTALCRERGVSLIVNDHADAARAHGASGAHVGQHDLSVAAARSVLHPWQLVGTSNALVDEAVASAQAGADYVAVGRMFETASKTNTRHAGPETLRSVREALGAEAPPLVAIGGINAANAAEVAAAGADGVAVMSAVTAAPDPRAAAARLLEAFAAAKG